MIYNICVFVVSVYGMALMDEERSQTTVMIGPLVIEEEEQHQVDQMHCFPPHELVALKNTICCAYRLSDNDLNYLILRHLFQILYHYT